MSTKQSLIAKNIDILEEAIWDIHPSILQKLLEDKTTKKNILWGTTDYESMGEGFKETDHIDIEHITGEHKVVIQPRAAKAKKVQTMRIRSRAEVFTPSWVCNVQNNLIDNAWFGRENVFNTPQGTSWTSTTERIAFDEKGKKSWKAYVEDKRLEITCGEAPYLVSRYDTTTGDLIPVYERIGLFDRKMRVVNENCKTDEEWLAWSNKALHSVYGYEFQGDSVLIARENLLYAYIDYYKERFGSEPEITLLKGIANIIAWNIWQMDGLKMVVPYSCHETEEVIEKQLQLSFGDDGNCVENKDAGPEVKIHPCPGCAKSDVFSHNGIYCRIFDWTNLKKSIPFVDMLREQKKQETLKDFWS